MCSSRVRRQDLCLAYLYSKQILTVESCNKLMGELKYFYAIALLFALDGDVQKMLEMFIIFYYCMFLEHVRCENFVRDNDDYVNDFPFY